jgi:hypothetical protein
VAAVSLDDGPAGTGRDVHAKGFHDGQRITQPAGCLLDDVRARCTYRG